MISKKRRRRVADENRKRAPRACDRCKARKSKCVELDTGGKCQRCELHNLTCRFEKEKSPCFSNPPQSSPQRSEPAPVPVLEPGAALDLSNSSGSVPCDNMTDESHEILSQSSTLSKGLANHGIDQSKRAPWPNILSRLREAFSLDPHAAPEEGDMFAMQARMTSSREPHASELSRLCAVIDSFPPRPVADFLLTVFIDHATDTFFYVDQHQFLSDIDEFYLDVNSSLRSDPGFVCLAMAAFALGSHWTWVVRPEGRGSSYNREIDLGRVFYRHAKTIVPDIIDRSCLRSIQAVFILGVYLMPENAIGSSYIYMGIALRKAMALDLHVQTEDQGMDGREREIRRRLWWSIYSLERCTTIKLNRPRSICADSITASHPSPYAPLDQLQKYDNIQYQMAYDRLIKILDQIADLSDVLTDPAELSRCMSSAADLKAWKNSLPADFKLSKISSKTSSYRTVFHLYLNYYYAWITMGKVALVTVARTKLRQNSPSELKPPHVDEIVQNMAESCAKSARKILRLFEQVTGTHNVTGFSFTDFQGCSIATIVTLLAGILERDSGYEASIKFGLNCLRRMSRGNMTAKIGVKFVEAVQSITNEARRKYDDATTFSRDHLRNPDATIDSGYSEWAEWMREQDASQRKDRTGFSRDNAINNDVIIPQETAAWQLSHPTLSGESSWQATGDSIFPASSLIPEDFGADTAVSQPSEIDLDVLHGLHTDEHTFFMGLTGLDSLDFSELTGQL
ncbi:transcriptional regulator family: Fungal Specific TF [Penicillium taxi]|uniref:transcriptional regulator family: Fungal Specific TF n=1 Tax=Penicillium taxi TaxID=168475 RepID=UPI002544EFE2|nr:transcriptional regulator family: Fungal Specific TF [Penicillium taxi]KAJ5893640.1 transcriptional regulator family: Fungal Specific TF [Penicillium taxi]